jgi:hypothetical protein
MWAWAAAFSNRSLKRPKFSILSIGRLFSDLKGGRLTVKTKSFCKIIALALFILVLFFSLQTLAAEKEVVRVQGRVMEIDLEKNRMVVNEKIFTWNKKTVFLDEKETLVKPDQLKIELKIDRKVYIEGERTSKQRTILIKEIRLLPK